MYIQSANQISVQKPLSDDWFYNPIFYEEKRIPTINPDFTPYFSSLQSRRLCVLLKRAIVLSRVTLREAAIEMPDAIISGTGLGCIDNTEKFLYTIMENKETFLQPTFFMQSTHNILSSTIAIDLKCHGYNNTFVHRGVSFENALLDAVMQMEQGRIQQVLVGGYDELTDDYYQFFKRIGTWDFEEGTTPKRKCFSGEAAVCMALSNTCNENTIGELNDVELMYQPTAEQMQQTLDAMLEKAGCQLTDIDVVLTGLNTHVEYDRVYMEAIDRFFGGLPVLQYKHVFGESFSSSALAVYIAVTCLRKGYAPAFLSVHGDEDVRNIKRILVYNHYRNKAHSLTLLSSCSNSFAAH